MIKSFLNLYNHLFFFSIFIINIDVFNYKLLSLLIYMKLQIIYKEVKNILKKNGKKNKIFHIKRKKLKS